MKKIIAVPVDNNGELDAHFGHCKFFAMHKIENGEITSEEKLVPPPHEPGVLPKWLAEKGATDIIAGGMGQKAIQIFNANKVNVFVGAPTQVAKELVESFLKEELQLTSNYCDH